MKTSVKENIEAKKAIFEAIENVFNSTEYDYNYLTTNYNKCLDGTLEGIDPQYYSIRIQAYDKIYAALEKLI